MVQRDPSLLFPQFLRSSAVESFSSVFSSLVSVRLHPPPPHSLSGVPHASQTVKVCGEPLLKSTQLESVPPNFP